MGLTPHRTWDILDSSKIAEYMTCPRKYFYRYILGWELDRPNLHLVFGESWHRAMEVLMKEGYNGTAISHAFERFMDYYRRYFGDELDESHRPKDPENAMAGLIEYCRNYKEDDFEVLHTEIHGTVPMLNNKLITARMDSICHDKRGYFSLEHKTSSYMSSTWQEQWQLKGQMNAYSHVLYCMFPENEVYGIVINGAFFKKTAVDFMRMPLRRTPRALNVWLTNMEGWMKQVEIHTEIVQRGDQEDDEVMTAFPMNTESCIKYNRACKFMDNCLAWENPLKRVDDKPIGFTEKWWDPSAIEEGQTKMEAGVIIKDNVE